MITTAGFIYAVWHNRKKCKVLDMLESVNANTDTPPAETDKDLKTALVCAAELKEEMLKSHLFNNTKKQYNLKY